MATGKRRLKLQAARAHKRVAKFAQYERRASEQPSEDTSYGKRWHARRRGEPMKSRSHEARPWFWPVIFATAPGRRPIRSRNLGVSEIRP